MVAPVVTAFTQEWFDSLPEFIRAADEATGWTTLRFLSLVGDQADLMRVLYERIDFTPRDEGGLPGDISELVSADLADAAWLPFLALAVGVPPGGRTAANLRPAIASAALGWRGPTKGAIADAARGVLTGSKQVTVADHMTSTGVGGQWDVLVQTRSSQSVSAQAVIDAVLNAGAKPAGVVLWYGQLFAAWSAVETRYPTWADWEAAGSWSAIEEAGF